MQQRMRGSGVTILLAAALLSAGCSLSGARGGAGPTDVAELPAAGPQGSGLLASATWSRKVNAGVSVADIEAAFVSVATEDNLRPAGEMFISGELERRSGQAGKFLKIYSYCDPAAARLMVDYQPALAAFMPCRIAVVEQADGLWIYTMNMDLLIGEGQALPPELGNIFRRFRASVRKMLDRGAAGEF